MRRGSKVSIDLPVFKDKNTQIPVYGSLPNKPGKNGLATASEVFQGNHFVYIIIFVKISSIWMPWALVWDAAAFNLHSR